MNEQHASHLDGDVEALVRHSWLGRLAERIGRHGQAAWHDSHARRWVGSADAGVRDLQRQARVQGMAIIGVVATLVHVGLVLIHPRPVEPVALVLPLLLFALCVAAFWLAGRLAALLERLG